MEQINLKKALQKTKIKAEWIGLREVKEISTQRLIRDLNPGLIIQQSTMVLWQKFFQMANLAIML